MHDLFKIKEIADIANVSTATVSRVLNNSGKVSSKTQERVWKVIEEHGYKPNLLAKHFRQKKSNTILVVLPTISNLFFTEIVRGLQEACDESGYKVIVGTTEKDFKKMQVYTDLLENYLVDGALFVSSSINKETLLRFVNKYPVVLCNEFIKGVDTTFIAIDNKQAGYDATSYMLSNGKNKLAYVRGEVDSSSVIRRLAGFKQALAEYDIRYDPSQVMKENDNKDKMRRSVVELLKQGVNGFVVHSDSKAVHILKMIKELGYTVPNEVSIISFDGTELTEIVEPALSSITQPMHSLGYEAVKLLIDSIENKHRIQDIRKVILPHTLTVRET